MAPITIPDFTCAHCGNRETLMLVKAPPGLVNREVAEHGRAKPPPGLASADAEEHRRTGVIPELDWTCSRCGTVDTYELVPRH